MQLTTTGLFRCDVTFMSEVFLMFILFWVKCFYNHPVDIESRLQSFVIPPWGNNFGVNWQFLDNHGKDREGPRARTVTCLTPCRVRCLLLLACESNGSVEMPVTAKLTHTLLLATETVDNFNLTPNVSPWWKNKMATVTNLLSISMAQPESPFYIYGLARYKIPLTCMFVLQHFNITASLCLYVNLLLAKGVHSLLFHTR